MVLKQTLVLVGLFQQSEMPVPVQETGTGIFQAFAKNNDDER